MTRTRTDLSRDRIVDEAIALLSDEGGGRLSMRRLAQRLGTSTMSTYHHVADKSDLVEAIAARLMSSLEAPAPDASWDEAARTLAWSFRAVSRKHPAAFELMLSAPTPGALAETAAEVTAVFERSGFTPVEAQRIFRLFVRYLLGSFTVEQDLGGAERDEQFGFGLDALIAGVAALHPDR